MFFSKPEKLSYEVLNGHQRYVCVCVCEYIFMYVCVGDRLCGGVNMYSCMYVSVVVCVCVWIYMYAL